MAGAGYKLFQTGDVLTATEVNTYLQQQVTMVFANSTARTTALSGVLAEGMMSYLQDTNLVEVYDGSSWVSVGNTGDITGVTAGAGLTGGGTSGTVTLTNDMATTITAKGDLLVGTGSATYDNLAVGTNGYTLVADSSVSPTGVKWAVDPVADVVTTAGDILYATAADTLTRLGIGTAGQVLKVNSGATAPEWGAAGGSSFVGCKAYHNTTQSISGSYTQVSFNSEVFDTDGFHSTTTNTSRFTIPSGKDGKYRFSFGGLMANIAQDARIVARIYKNGSGQSLTTAYNAAFGDGAIQMTDIFDLVATDYLEIYLNQSSGLNKDLEGGTTYNWVTLEYLGA